MTLADHKRGAIVSVVCRTVRHAEENADNVSAVTPTADVKQKSMHVSLVVKQKSMHVGW